MDRAPVDLQRECPAIVLAESLDNGKTESKPLCLRPAGTPFTQFLGIVNFQAALVTDGHFMLIDPDADRALITGRVFECVAYQVADCDSKSLRMTNQPRVSQAMHVDGYVLVC